jgi:hypothetical protein
MNEEGGAIDRVPRTAAEQSLLLSIRPPGWEYLLLGSALYRGKSELEDKWREYESLARRPPDFVLDEDNAIDYLTRALHENSEIVGDLDQSVGPRSQQRAFGKPGRDGDPKRITHLAEAYLATYDDLLSWSVDLRAEGVPPKYRRLYDIAAEMADAPLRQIRDFIDDTVAKLDGLPLAVRQGVPITIELTLEIKLDDEVMARYQGELDRLAGEARPARPPIPESVRNEIWRRDQGRCVDCGSKERIEFDHIIPISRGGSNTARNIELRCETCNRRKGARI